jgi:hypothetical protein
MWTKKDFIKLADAIATAQVVGEADRYKVLVENIIWLCKENPNFDESRFREAAKL